MPTYYYTYSGGFAGTEEHGLIKANSEEQAASMMEDNALGLATEWFEDPRGYGGTLGDDNVWRDSEGDEIFGEPESDLNVELYDPEEHNPNLDSNDPLYVKTDWDD